MGEESRWSRLVVPKVGGWKDLGRAVRKNRVVGGGRVSLGIMNNLLFLQNLCHKHYGFNLQHSKLRRGVCSHVCGWGGVIGTHLGTKGSPHLKSLGTTGP